MPIETLLKIPAVDVCEQCGREFGYSGQDENGYNCTCVSCGNNTYKTTRGEGEDNE